MARKLKRRKIKPTASVKLAPASPEAHFSLAYAYAMLGRKDDAAREREEFQRLRKLLDSNQP